MVTKKDFLNIEYTEYDYPEDKILENGNYMNTCISCEIDFYGYKRRPLCKVCDKAYKQQKGGIDE